MRRLHIGRWQVYFEPRDWWIGVYIAPQAIYVCPLPTVVFKYNRRPRLARCEAATRHGQCHTRVATTAGRCPLHTSPSHPHHRQVAEAWRNLLDDDE